MKNIYNKIYATLKRWHISGWQQFKERKQQRLEKEEYLKLIGDWYYQHSWFERKWFLHKLKRVIMNFVYKFTDKIEEFLYNITHESYVVEFMLFDNDNDFKIAYLPLIIECKQGKNIQYIVAEINEQLVLDFHYKVVNTGIIKILNKTHRLEIENKIISDYKNQNIVDHIGNIDFNTVLRKNKPKINNLLPFNSDFDFSQDKILNNQEISFGIIKTRNSKKYINKFDNYKIWIKYQEE